MCPDSVDNADRTWIGGWVRRIVGTLMCFRPTVFASFPRFQCPEVTSREVTTHLITARNRQPPDIDRSSHEDVYHGTNLRMHVHVTNAVCTVNVHRLAVDLLL
jgi:hypothetical protein